MGMSVYMLDSYNCQRSLYGPMKDRRLVIVAACTSSNGWLERRKRWVHQRSWLPVQGRRSRGPTEGGRGENATFWWRASCWFKLIVVEWGSVVTVLFWWSLQVDWWSFVQELWVGNLKKLKKCSVWRVIIVLSRLKTKWTVWPACLPSTCTPSDNNNTSDQAAKHRGEKSWYYPRVSDNLSTNLKSIAFSLWSQPASGSYTVD